MTNYLSAINRNQFAQFYRFGYTYISTSSLVKFEGSITDNVKKELIIHFASLSPFEYDEEYLILHLAKSIENTEQNVLFNIQDITAIYPLSRQAKLSIAEKIDQRINLREPIFESILPKIEATIQKKEIEKAIDAIWIICEIEGDKAEVIDLIGIDNILQGLSYRQQGVKANKIQGGNYWSILLAYDRFDYFPNEIIGFFYDAGKVFAYSKNQLTFEGSGLHSYLTTLSQTLKMPQIRKELELSEITKSYCTQTDFGKLKGYVVAPLFFMLQSEIRKVEDIYATKLKQFPKALKEYGIDFKAAAVLLGAFFGFKKFYDVYYDTLNLKFYKSYGSDRKEKSEELTMGGTLEKEIQVEIVKIESTPESTLSDIQKQSVPDNTTSSGKQKSQRKKGKHTPDLEVDTKPVSKEVIKEKKTSKKKEIDRIEVPIESAIVEVVERKKIMVIGDLVKELKVQGYGQLTSIEVLEKISTSLSDKIESRKDKNTYRISLRVGELF